MALLDNLVSYWGLDESSPGSSPVSRADRHGSNTLGDFNNVPSTTGLVYSNAASLVAANSTALYISSNSTVQMGDIDFSLAYWVKLTSKALSQFVLSKSDGTNYEYESSYSVSEDRYVARLYAAAGGSNATLVIANTFGSPATGAWHFVVARYNAAGDSLDISVNAGGADYNVHSGGAIALTTDLVFGVSPGIGDYLNAALGPVLFWKRYISGSEMTQLYNSGAGMTYAAMAASGGTALNVVLGEPALGGSTF